MSRADRYAKKEELKPSGDFDFKENELLERLAELEHEQWSEWIQYQWNQLVFGCKSIEESKNKWERWKALSGKNYFELSEKEKESDRKFARKVIDLLKESGR